MEITPEIFSSVINFTDNEYVLEINEVLLGQTLENILEMAIALGFDY